MISSKTTIAAKQRSNNDQCKNRLHFVILQTLSMIPVMYSWVTLLITPRPPRQNKTGNNHTVAHTKRYVWQLTCLLASSLDHPYFSHCFVPEMYILLALWAISPQEGKLHTACHEKQEKSCPRIWIYRIWPSSMTPYSGPITTVKFDAKEIVGFETSICRLMKLDHHTIGFITFDFQRWKKGGS